MQKRLIEGFLDWLWDNGYRVVKVGSRPEERPERETLLEGYADHLRKTTPSK